MLLCWQVRNRVMGDNKVVFGVALGTAFARSAVCTAAANSQAPR